MMPSFYQNEYADRESIREIPAGFELVDARTSRRFKVDAQLEIGVFESKPEKIIEPNAIAIVIHRIERLVRDPGEEFFFANLEPGLMPARADVSHGLVFHSGRFYRLPDSVSNVPSPGAWSEVPGRLRRPIVIDETDVWGCLVDLSEHFSWDEIDAAFGAGEALQAVRVAARAVIDGHIASMSPRAQSKYLKRIAEAEALGEYCSADYGPMAGEVFRDELSRVIASATVDELDGLLGRLTGVFNE